MGNIRRLRNAFSDLDLSKRDKDLYISARLGFLIKGTKTVEVDSRPGYVYARMRSNLNEVVQVFNDKVSPTYDLPVVLIRDPVDPTRYRVDSRDVGAYEVEWSTHSSFLPRHGAQHEFYPEGGGGGDIVWVRERQFTPLMVYPSGTNGANNVLIYPDYMYNYGDDVWEVFGGTGTVSLLTLKPTDNQARFVMVGVANNAFYPVYATGTPFSATITGTWEVAPYLPEIHNDMDFPLAAIRLVSGTQTILWDNIYDLRAFGIY